VWLGANATSGMANQLMGKIPVAQNAFWHISIVVHLFHTDVNRVKKLIAGFFPVGFHGSKQSFISWLHPVSTVWWGYTYYFCTMLLHQTHKFYIVNVASIPIHYEHMLLGVLFRSKKLHKLFIKLHKKFFVDLPIFRTANDGIWWGACSPV